MPSFAIKDVQSLADFLNPVTQDMAEEIIAHARAVEDGEVYAAFYYWGPGATPKRQSFVIRVKLYGEDDNYLAHVWTDDYRPRKDGKADLVYKTEYHANW